MYNSKLINILKVFNSEEKELLKKWVNSPAHNHRKDRKKLFNYLLSKRKTTPFTSDRYKAYHYIYPNETYNDNKLKRLMNLGVQLLEEFIHFLMQNENSFSKHKSLINFLGRHNLDKYAEQYISKTQNKQDRTVLENSGYFYQQYELEKGIFELQSSSIDRGKTNLQSIFDNSYLSFVLETLHYACEAITHQRLYKSEYNIPMLKHILADIESGAYNHIPAIQMYYYSYMALNDSEEESHFETLKSLLFKNYNILNPKEIKSIYLVAINYCVQKLNTGKEAYVRSVFELFQYGLKHHILIENNILSRFTYKNIVTAALRLKEYSWVVQFIEKYTPLVEGAYQKPYALYANAKLHFTQGDFDKTLELLAKVEFDNLFLSMDAKIMLLKIYYERDYFDALDALLISFRRFLQRKSILAYQRTIHKNMIRLTEKLINIPSHNKTRILALREEINNTNPLTEKPWLLSQLDKF